ncbi:MAG TPA: peptidylprolyl isomerase [Cytophagaceae bacterium]|jgi:cyclophilin family peptidyl-prolyl cis-trans isomerase|nr:peptidylprolyl isomerase [Cytophagaceae bacterium]
MMKYALLTFMLIPAIVFGQKKKKTENVAEPVIYDYVVTIKVSYLDSAITGTKTDSMIAILYDRTPKHRDNFVKLANEGFYNGTTFHRIITGFMIQGGDPNSKDNNPTNEGVGGPGYTIPAEIDPGYGHKKGAIAAARLGDNMNPQRESSGSQFYIVQTENGAQHLNGQYTVFGQVIKNLALIDQIASQLKDQRDRPIYDIKMNVSVRKMDRKLITRMYGYQFK